MNRFRRWLWLMLIFVGIVLFLLWYHPILESGIPKDASNWVEKQTGADFQGFSLMETRQYAPFLLLLGHGNSGESAYLLSYEQILFLPIYRRYMLVSNAAGIHRHRSSALRLFSSGGDAYAALRQNSGAGMGYGWKRFSGPLVQRACCSNTEGQESIPSGCRSTEFSTKGQSRGSVPYSARRSNGRLVAFGPSSDP